MNLTILKKALLVVALIAPAASWAEYEEIFDDFQAGGGGSAETTVNVEALIAEASALVRQLNLESAPRSCDKYEELMEDAQGKIVQLQGAVSLSCTSRTTCTPSGDSCSASAVNLEACNRVDGALAQLRAVRQGATFVYTRYCSMCSQVVADNKFASDDYTRYGDSFRSHGCTQSSLDICSELATSIHNTRESGQGSLHNYYLDEFKSNCQSFERCQGIAQERDRAQEKESRTTREYPQCFGIIAGAGGGAGGGVGGSGEEAFTDEFTYE